MSKNVSNGFRPTPKSPRPIVISATPAEKITRTHLDCLFSEANRFQQDVSLFRSRAILRPHKRLIVNLKSALSALEEAQGSRDYVFLTRHELLLLTQMQAKKYSTEALVAAHALLNLAERQTFMQFFKRAGHEVKVRDDAVVDPQE